MNDREIEAAFEATQDAAGPPIAEVLADADVNRRPADVQAFAIADLGALEARIAANCATLIDARFLTLRNELDGLEGRLSRIRVGVHDALVVNRRGLEGLADRVADLEEPPEDDDVRMVPPEVEPGVWVPKARLDEALGLLREARDAILVPMKRQADLPDRIDRLLQDPEPVPVVEKGAVRRDPFSPSLTHSFGEAIDIDGAFGWKAGR